MPTSWQRRTTTLSQCRKLTSPQISFFTLPQRYDIVNHDVAKTLSQRRRASWDESQQKSWASQESDHLEESHTAQ